MDYPASCRTVSGMVLHLLRSRLVRGVVVLFMTGAVSAAATQAVASQVPDSSTITEFTIPPLTYPLSGPGPVEVSSVELWDLGSGYQLPLTGAGVGDVDGATVAYLPELEQGTYEIRWVATDGPRAERFAVVTETFTTNGDLAVRPAEPAPTAPTAPTGPVWFIAIAGFSVGLFAAVLLRRRTKVASVVFVLCAGAGVAGAMFATPDSTVTLSACRSLPMGSEQRFTCLRDYVYMSGSTPEAMMGVLDGLRSDATVVGDAEQHTCHNVAHLLGRLLVEKRFDVVDIVGADGGICDYGLMHGALENGGRLMSDAEWIDVLASVCATFTGDAALQCAHGAGHGTSIRTNSAVNPSLMMCAQLGGIEPERLLWQCATGVFMGYANRTMFAVRLPTIEAMEASLPDPHEMYMPSMCAQLSGVVRKSCWLGGFRFLGWTSLDVLESDERFTSVAVNADFCASLPDAGDCIQGVLVRARERAVGRSDDEVIAACARHEGELWEKCVFAFVQSEVARQNESSATDRYERVEQVCDTIDAARPGSKTGCLGVVRSVAAHLAS